MCLCLCAPAQVAQLPAVVDALSGTPFYHGMLAFALEQCGDSGGAEREGRRGTEVAPDDAWSHHAVAHALYNQVRRALCLCRGCESTCVGVYLRPYLTVSGVGIHGLMFAAYS